VIRFIRSTALIVLTAASLSAQGFPEIRLVLVADGLESPLLVTHAGDDRLFIVQQTGTILAYEDGSVKKTPFLDLSSKIHVASEQGLLGLAFPPDHEENGFFFVNYTNVDGDTTVARFSISSDPDVAAPASEELVMRIEQPFSNHNGGHLAFGPDGFLNIGRGGAGDSLNNAQTLTTMLGKLLRIDVSGALPYTIPSTNPFFDVDHALAEIWAYGLRNPWRFTFDRRTGDLLIGDVGQNEIEEINFQPAESVGGENYGWRKMEGSRCFNPSSGCNDGSLVLPILEYDHSGGRCSVTGGSVYRGARFPGLDGIYFYADHCTGEIWGARRSGEVWQSEILLSTGFLVSSFGEDAFGEIYVVDYFGAVWLIEGDPRPRRRGARR